MWRITMDHTCIGSGICVGIAPSRFELDDAASRSYPVTPDVEPDEAILDAVASCPMEAISVVDLTTGEPVEV
ncbi:ferredoxin [Dactylosporangium roseum]|uniref:Ferredoxin n=1 Tax=Dactylosporangium roseum TaxID=47989 RepID=A0ABY5Z9L8_9ACTN|nr:ferredoxin [Dactylosporangium roseum]UWZ38783.1 ferredoxin [Dactylosporangium roseum]